MSDEMRTALEKAAVRLEILTGRLRACGQHELMDEAEMFVYEARRALASAPATEAGGRVNWQAIAERRKNVIEGLFAALERIKAVSHRGAYGQRYLQHDASQMAEIAQEAYDTAMASAVDILRSIDERRALTAPADAREAGRERVIQMVKVYDADPNILTFLRLREAVTALNELDADADARPETGEPAS